MKDALLFACGVFILFGIGFWVIPKLIDFIITLYETNGLFDFIIFIALLFGIWCLGSGDNDIH